jgi:hypothetical protein
MTGLWREHIDNRWREFRRLFGGEVIVIRRRSIANAWICQLPNGKHIIGELADMHRAVEATTEQAGAARLGKGR